MPSENLLRLDEQTREQIWRQLIDAIESYSGQIRELPPTPTLDAPQLRAMLAPFTFNQPVPAAAAMQFVIDSLTRYQVHTPHPRYFGLFNPAPTTMGIAADALVAAFNPQLAAWSHSPFAAETERHLLRSFGTRFGYTEEQTEGTFCSGGAEANHTALLLALLQAFPEIASAGLRALPGSPVLYLSAEAHHSFLKAARASGLGTDAVRMIEVDHQLRMRVDLLEAQIRQDRAAGHLPFLIVATAGTTSAGAVDPIAALADLARREGLWLHLDAAWGGAACLFPELRPLLEGSERADSITFDLHKWFSVPMGAGLFLTRHRGALKSAFQITTSYMPKEAEALPVADPFSHSLQWSRRFIGLKVFLSLAVAGWQGYAEVVQHMVRMGDRLREGLQRTGWTIRNATPLPVVCFSDGAGDAAVQQAIVNEVLRTGAAWLSTTRVGAGEPVLRACITNYRTGPEDVDALIDAVTDARQKTGER